MKRHRGHAATMRSRQGRARKVGPPPSSPPRTTILAECGRARCPWREAHPSAGKAPAERPHSAGHPTQADDAQGRELNPAAFRCSRTRVFAGDPAVVPNGSNRGNFPNIGTLGRNAFRGRQQFYWDASFFKNFPITAISEAFNVQFRFSAYNVLNRVNRSSPNGDINNTNEFGRDVSEQRRRQMEFSLKLIF